MGEIKLRVQADFGFELGVCAGPPCRSWTNTGSPLRSVPFDQRQRVLDVLEPRITGEGLKLATELGNDLLEAFGLEDVRLPHSENQGMPAGSRASADLAQLAELAGWPAGSGPRD